MTGLLRQLLRAIAKARRSDLLDKSSLVATPTIFALTPRLSESSSDMAAGRWPSSILRPAARLVTFLSGPIPKPSRSTRIPAKSSSTCQMLAVSPSSTASRKSKSENGRHPIRAQIFRWRWTQLLFADVDHFKLYNDLHGHQKRDECLAQWPR
jgi:hypothetical protein